MPLRLRTGVVVALLAGALSALAASAPAFAAGSSGAAYVLSNAAGGNAVLAFDRAADGSLSPAGSYATGGLGLGAGLGSQGAVTLTDDGRFVLAVNAAGNSVSVFRTGPQGLELRDVEPSGGSRPTSVAARHGLVYVLNAGVPNSISGFRLGADGDLAPIFGSTRPLSGAATTPSQVGFAPNGVLVVTERGTNLIDTFVVDGNGVAAPGAFFPSGGLAPFGFGFGHGGTLVVSDAAGASGASSYLVSADGFLTAASPLVASGRRAACWIAAPANGRYAYATNGGTGDVTGFSIGGDGSLSLLADGGVTGVTGGAATDPAFSVDSQFLYVRDAGLGRIVGFRAASDGSLARLASSPVLPATAAGIAVR